MIISLMKYIMLKMKMIISLMKYIMLTTFVG